MSKPLYIELLDREERGAALKLGYKLAYLQLGVKQADGVLDTTLSAVEKAILGVAVFTGVPLGIAGHMLTRASKSDELAQRERRAKIRYYRDITSELGQGLAGTNPVPAKI